MAPDSHDWLLTPLFGHTVRGERHIDSIRNTNVYQLLQKKIQTKKDLIGQRINQQMQQSLEQGIGEHLNTSRGADATNEEVTEEEMQYYKGRDAELMDQEFESFLANILHESQLQVMTNMLKQHQRNGGNDDLENQLKQFNR